MTQLVTVDIGGTHARFALATVAADGSIELGEPATLHTRDHASFQTAWEDFARMQGGSLPDAVAIAVAGPVGGEVIRFTNNPWIIRPALIPEKLGASRYTVVNDFGAVGHAVARAGDEHFVHLTGPEASLPASGTISIVGPGTGLGVAHVWRDGQGGYRVQPTEGGHIDFAALDEFEERLLARLRERDDLPFVGLIGSQTKWATFRHRLEARGFSEAEIARVTCPIGVPGIAGKEPEVIAVAVAAQLLQTL